MAKLFYTLEEAAAKLGKSTDEVMNMAKAGQLQELRDKDQILFRRSAIDQIAGDSDAGSELNLDALGLPSDGSAISLQDTDGGLGDGLALEDTAELAMDELRLDDDLGLDSGTAQPQAPIAASGADDSLGLDDLALADDEPSAPPAPSRPATPAAPPPSPAASAAGLSARSSIGLADSSPGAARSAMGLAGSSAGSRAGTRMMSGSGSGVPVNSDDSMAMNSPPVEAVGSGSALLDISSDESFFGAQMIEESMGGDEMAAMPEGAANLFGEGDAQAGGDEVAPVQSAPAQISFGTTALAEALDPKFSGFAGGAMVAAAVGLVGMAFAVVEIMVGNYTDFGRMIAENWMYVIGGVAGGILVFGGIGFGIGKATA